MVKRDRIDGSAPRARRLAIQGGFTAAASVGLACLSAMPAVAGTVAAGQSFYGTGYPSIYSPEPLSGERRTNVRQAARQRTNDAKSAPKAEAAKPAGPLTIAVSIGSQHVTLYDEATPIGNSPVSTGMPGHLTPMGVFSVIQKDRFHHSNIYSNAPMPYMQRITWSGVALHAGVLPGYPASHGCIRLPESFAVRLWNTTTLGVRVIVARNEVVPHPISHPLLAALTTPPPEPVQPPAATEPQASLSAPVNSAAVAPTMAAAPQAAGAKPLDAVKRDGEVSAADTVKADQPTEGTGDPVAPAAKDSVAAAEPGPVPPILAAAQPERPASAPASETAAAGADKPAPVIGGFVQTEEIPLPGIKPAKAVSSPGPLSMLVSRKTGKLYVRKGFEPMFEMPIAIANKDLPLGTHVFTAGHPAAGGGLQWIVMSIGNAQAPEPKSRSRGAREAKPASIPEGPASSAAEALNRIEIPQDVIDEIAPYMTSGASLMISDLGISGETNKGTDFILVMR